MAAGRTTKPSASVLNQRLGRANAAPWRAALKPSPGDLWLRTVWFGVQPGTRLDEDLIFHQCHGPFWGRLAPTSLNSRHDFWGALQDTSEAAFLQRSTGIYSQIALAQESFFSGGGCGAAFQDHGQRLDARLPLRVPVGSSCAPAPRTAPGPPPAFLTPT